MSEKEVILLKEGDTIYSYKNNPNDAELYRLSGRTDFIPSKKTKNKVFLEYKKELVGTLLVGVWKYYITRKQYERFKKENKVENLKEYTRLMKAKYGAISKELKRLLGR